MGKKESSRPARWARACSQMREALDELTGLKGEYEEWRGNLPENQDGSPVAEKLDAIADLDLDSVESVVSECEGVELPLGFGRD